MEFNRMNDYYVKRLLGTEKNKKVTLAFLNDVLERSENDRFTDVSFKDKEMLPDGVGGKASRLDICAQTNDGTLINIEIQVRSYKMMFERALYYWAKLFTKELQEGKPYSTLEKTISIVITKFNCLPWQKNWHTACYLMDEESGKRLTEHLAIHLFELPKFRCTELRRLKRKENWMAYFSNQGTDKEWEELAMKDETMKLVMKYEKSFQEKPEERAAYEQHQKFIHDYVSDMEEAEEKGMEKGRIEGKIEERQETIQNMIKAGISMKQISVVYHMSEEQINALL